MGKTEMGFVSDLAAEPQQIDIDRSRMVETGPNAAELVLDRVAARAPSIQRDRDLEDRDGVEIRTIRELGRNVHGLCLVDRRSRQKTNPRRAAQPIDGTPEIVCAVSEIASQRKTGLDHPEAGRRGGRPCGGAVRRYQGLDAVR